MSTVQSDWWVYSTAVGDGAILVENRSTGQRGIISHPTPDEWSDAFHAPSSPYRWLEPERIAVDHAGV
jgi:hypothetical protein